MFFKWFLSNSPNIDVFGRMVLLLLWVWEVTNLTLVITLVMYVFLPKVIFVLLSVYIEIWLIMGPKCSRNINLHILHKKLCLCFTFLSPFLPYPKKIPNLFHKSSFFVVYLKQTQKPILRYRVCWQPCHLWRKHCQELRNLDWHAKSSCDKLLHFCFFFCCLCFPYRVALHSLLVILSYDYLLRLCPLLLHFTLAP